MTVDALLIELAQHGVRLKLLSNGQLSLKVPKGGLLETLRERIVEHKEALVESLRRKQSAKLLEELPMPVPDVIARHESFPLSDVQHAYWIGRNAHFDLGGVSTHAYFEIETALDIARLEIALQKLIVRHDMLRAVIDSDGRQRVLPEIPPYHIRTLDARGKPALEQETAILAVRDRMSHQVLPTDRCPLFAVAATLLEESRAILHISIDMLIMDGASLLIFFEEWSRFYREPDWQPEPVPVFFRDYILAEQTLRERPSYRQAREYWMKRLDDMPAAPQLPHLVSPPETPHFVRRVRSLPRDDWQRLKERAKTVGITSSVLVLTAFAETLRRWSRETDFTINLTLFNRLPLHPAINQVLGEFTSVSMMTTRARSSESFAERAQRMQRQLYADLEHRQFSGVRVLQERARCLGTGPSAAMPVVFTSLLGLGAEEQGANIVDFFGNMRYSISQTPQVHLDCQAFERGGGLTINWDAVEALYPTRMLNDMFESYQGLLQHLAQDDLAWHTQTPLVALPAWQETERRAANATRTDIPFRTLHGLVVEQAMRTPEAVAVIIADDGARTYRELMTCATRLARRLLALGALRNTLIAVAMDKGWEQIVATLGVLQSGAAYLPIDPSLPANRRAVLLEQGQVELVVTQSHHQMTLEWPADVAVLTLHDEATQACSAEPLALPEAVDDLAYVIFTSGSTGIPKGVQIDHRGAANTVQDINQRFNVDRNDRVLALSSLSFDLSVYDIFGLLSVGGTIVLPAAGRVTDPSHWTELVERHHITLWNSVPQLLQLWIDHLERMPCPRQGPRLALLSGDWIPVKLPGQARARYPEMQIVSLGGATEASIWSVYYPITEVHPEWKSIPYGKPLANQTLHIYNELSEPCAIFTPGDLYIGGIGLAKGYWGDPQKTAERFITHPHTGERLYKTGDLGRYLPGGDIEFLGREDSQVKVNGYRVELGEVAMHLRNCPGVSDALVSVAARDEQHSKQLVAYVIPETSVASHAAATTKAGADHDEDHPWMKWIRAGAGALRAYHDAHRETLEAGEKFFRQCDALAPLVMASTLARLGFFVTAGEQCTARRIGDQHGLAVLKIALVEKWLGALATAGMLTQTSRRGEYGCKSPFDIDELNKEIHGRLTRLRAPAALQPLVGFTRWCVEHQQQLLLGQADIRERMFANGDGEVADSVYRHNPVSAMHNHAAATLLRTVVDSMTPDKRLRILEIGAGTGATTAAVLPVLPSERTSYVFTDISLFFMEHAKRHLAAPAFVEHRLFDIDQSPLLQGLELGSFDIIVAAGTLHNAKDIDKTLARVRSLLVPSGLLLMSETTRDADSMLLSFGHLEAFGHQEDWRREAHRTLPSCQEWEKCLHDAGFMHITCLGDDPDGDQSGDQHTVLAQAPAEMGHLDLSRLREALAQTLPEHMVPHHFVLLNEFPLSANGKVDIKALPIPWSERSSNMSVRAVPTNPVEQQLHDMWCELLERKEISVDDNFFELGGDSLIAVHMVGRLQQQFAVDEEVGSDLLGYVFQHPTIAQLSRFLLVAGTCEPLAHVQHPGKAWSPLVQLRATGENMPCFFMHGADGNVLRYRELAERFSRPFYALQAPGLSSEQAPPLETIEQMATFYRQAIQQVRPTGPYLLGGWSAGGLIAFEIARQLEMQGQRIERVVMIDAPSPAPGGPVDDARLLRWFLDDMDIGIDVEKMDAVEIFPASRGVLTSALALIRQRQGIRVDIDVKQLERVFEVFRRTVHAASCYRPQTLLHADISVLRASEERVREFGQHWANTAEDWGWSRHTSGRVHSATVSGTHYSLLCGKNLDMLIGRLTSVTCQA